MDTLKQMRQWLCWNAREKDGRTTKVPCAPDGGATGTNTRYSHTWVTCDEAMAAMQLHGHTGVGFVIPEGCFFLDVDHRDTDDPLVQKLLQRFGSYTERSFSGNGMHIYGHCDMSRLPIRDGRLDRCYYTKNPRNGLELYIGGVTNRFAVFTGDAIQDVPLADCTDAILATLEEDMRREHAPQPAASACMNAEDTPVSDETIFEIVTALRQAKNGEKFRRLFDDGDTTGYGSHSEADAALCAVIAFRAGPNAPLIDAIFRKSALYREEKWEREDYRDLTIACGIEACRGTFHHDVLPPPPPFVVIHPRNGSEVISTTRLASYIRQHLHYFFVQDQAVNTPRCYVYRDGVYQMMSPTMMEGVIKQFIIDYDENLVKSSTLSEVYRLLLTDNFFVSEDHLNVAEDLINFRNGLLHLPDMKLLPHSPEVLSTIQLPCNWPGGPKPTPVFDAYMDTLTGGERELRQLLEEFSGVCLSNVRGWRLKKALFMYGPGDTGKSVLKTLVENLLGKGNFIGIDLAEIEARFGTGSIYGKRLAGSSDMSFLSVSELKTFKKCTGGDSLFAEFKGHNSFEFTYSGLLWFCMNQLPKFGGDNGKWVHDRIVQVPCKRVIPQNKQDKHLVDRLLAEREGIVYRLVMALQQVIRSGYRLSEPASVRDERSRYQRANSTVITFFEDCMQPLPIGEKRRYSTVMQVYAAYQGWCRDNNRGFARTTREFREELAAHLGVDAKEMTVRHREGMVYRSHTLTQEALDYYIHGRLYSIPTGEFTAEEDEFPDFLD